MLVKLITTICVSIGLLAVPGCMSTGENQEFTHAYKLLPSESYMSGEDKCEKTVEDMAKQALEVESVEILSLKSAMAIDMETGKSSVECTLIVAPPKPAN